MLFIFHILERVRWHQIINKTLSTYIENKMNVNGLLTENEDLYLAVKDALYNQIKTKTYELLLQVWIGV